MRCTRARKEISEQMGGCFDGVFATRAESCPVLKIDCGNLADPGLRSSPVQRLAEFEQGSEGDAVQFIVCMLRAINAAE